MLVVLETLMVLANLNVVNLVEWTNCLDELEVEFD